MDGRSCYAELSESTQGGREVSSEATKAFVRGECGEDGWVSCGSEAPLYRLFSSGVLLFSEISVGLNSSGWVKSSVGCVNSSISTAGTLCICWSSWVCPSSSGVLDELIGKFLRDP